MDEAGGTYKLNFTEEFNNYMQQDAHEFLNFLINRINEIILRKFLGYSYVSANCNGKFELNVLLLIYI